MQIDGKREDEARTDCFVVEEWHDRGIRAIHVPPLIDRFGRSVRVLAGPLSYHEAVRILAQIAGPGAKKE